MTAEIGVLNKQAIALAADSAVTIRGAHGQKIYNHANKLFMLSKCNPIGIMIYGNAELTGVPWETIIKMYRESSSDKCFDYLDDYCRDFLDFLEKDPFLFFVDTRQSDDFYGISYIYLKKTMNKIGRVIEDFVEEMSDEEVTSGLKSEVVVSLVKQSLEFELEVISNIPYLEGFSLDDVEQLISRYDEILDKVIDSSWTKFPKDDEIVQLLKMMVGYYFNKDIFNDYSGVVFAGFGNKEIFPAMTAYIVESKVNGNLKLKINPEKTKNLNNSSVTSSLVPFAQDDMVQTIASGVDPDIDNFSFKLLKSSMSDLANKLAEEIQGRMDYEEEDLNKLTNNLQEITEELLESYMDQTFQYRRENHALPLVDTIDIMPKEELAVIAETMVNLTSFKRKISSDSETVGGPVDVALITKGDGFIWIKRKHYFDPNLNSHYFENKRGGNTYER
ncbi:hypothetical protein [Paenibacillus sp. FSL R10-2771]|uniref:hypothetical protein n=1 Tax=Paenibacillus sp. FSL R10-2771 TaxID=2954693 RepID=UPI0030FA8022